MFSMRRAFYFILGSFAALASSAAPAPGSSIGFHEYLKHPHSDAIVLPRLYEPQPKHVPELSDKALLRLWESNQISPILRNPGIELQLYEAVHHERDRNPARFDAAHPSLGHMFRDQQFFQYALHLYNTHTARFVHYHHHLVPVIRGYAMELMRKPQPPGPEQVVGTGSSFSPPPAAESLSNLPVPQTLTVPEPLSIVMMVLGLGFVAARVYMRRQPGTC
jgi:hypothetical protein